MATMNSSQINKLAEVSQGFIPQAAEAPMTTFLSLVPITSAPYTPRLERALPERRPSGFLTLAPATSASYPQAPRSRYQSVTHLTRPLPLTHGAMPEEDVAIATPRSMSSSLASIQEPKSRRSSSMSSDGSSRARLRFLKLGPVHWGEHQGDHKGDWHELDEEAISP
jgi:hypothetical protein